VLEQFDTGILARDPGGEEHRLRVAEHPGPLISIGDDDMARILAPAAAHELCWQLLRIIGRRQPAAGPLSTSEQSEVA
jgi:hypothetical protein